MTMYSYLIFAILLSFSSAYGGGLTVGYYDKKCPEAEDTIRNAVGEAVKNNKGLCAGILRLHFHDCFVRGCDGSVLLEKNASSNPNPEKYAENNLSLRGFQVIEVAKDAVEKKCKQSSPLVSCADVLAFAARDCIKILVGDNFSGYSVPAGRLDGKVSKAEEAMANLPAPNSSFTKLKDMFGKNNLSVEDLTVLSNAHSVGVSHCSSFKDRFNPIKKEEIDEEYAKSLKRQCTDDFVTVPQDNVTPDKLDVQWYKNMQANKVLFFSDWVLRTNDEAERLMTAFAKDEASLQLKFITAMQKMGQIPSEGKGEIRRVCSAVN